MNKETGGSAFPTSNWQKMAPLASGYHEGMTLRDYFAARAMQADLSTYSEDLIYESQDWFVARAEKWYEVADAMLKAREQ